MKSEIRYLTILGLVISAGFFAGCEMPRVYGTTFHRGISPIYPAMNPDFETRYQTVDTLTPELKWKDLRKTNQTYDVCIWETPYRSVEDVKKKADQGQTSWGISVYCTTNVPANFHQVATRLKPDTYYNWSVRIRDGENVGNWSTFSQQKIVLSVITEYDNTPFGFKTPAQ